MNTATIPAVRVLSQSEFRSLVDELEIAASLVAGSATNEEFDKNQRRKIAARGAVLDAFLAASRSR